MELAGKTALITGGSRGIGRAIALRLAAKGAGVALVYAGNTAAAKAAKAEIEAGGQRAEIYRCDVADFAATAQLVAAVQSAFGRVDILVNNAGIVRDNLVLKMTEEDFDAVVKTSLNGAFNLIKHLYQPFMRQRAGRIINIASVIGLCGNAGQANYAAAKAGLIGLTKSVAKELAARGVTCNAIAPGFIESDMTAALAEKVRDAALQAVPMRRMGTADEVAALAAFLAGDSAGYITGQVLQVDGGMCM